MTDPTLSPIQTLAPELRRLTAPNASPMTLTGTQTYLLGHSDVTVIDPGPMIEAHGHAILNAVGQGRVARILVTHAHLDHSPLSRWLADRTGAPVLAYGDARAGRSPRMAALGDLGDLGGGEGVDVAFRPDTALPDGARLDTEVGSIAVLWTPGHFGNHLSFLWRGAAFSGDLVMGWASTLVSPPDGDLSDFRVSCGALRAQDCHVLYPGHGDPVLDPRSRIDWLLNHRAARERQILAALDQSPASPAQITRRVYTDISPAMWPAATRNVLAHLVDLIERKEISIQGPLSHDTTFTRR